MPHVSSNKLDQKLLEKLFSKLLFTLGEAQNSKHLSSVVDELFSATEKIMFAKRLAIILMLESKTPQQKVVDILKVSPSTVARVALGIEIGKYSSILKVTKLGKLDFEKLIWSILTVGGIMPPKVGGKYWKKYSKN